MPGLNDGEMPRKDEDVTKLKDELQESTVGAHGAVEAEQRDERELMIDAVRAELECQTAAEFDESGNMLNEAKFEEWAEAQLEGGGFSIEVSMCDDGGFDCDISLGHRDYNAWVFEYGPGLLRKLALLDENAIEQVADELLGDAETYIRAYIPPEDFDEYLEAPEREAGIWLNNVTLHVYKTFALVIDDRSNEGRKFKRYELDDDLREELEETLDQYGDARCLYRALVLLGFYSPAGDDD